MAAYLRTVVPGMRKREHFSDFIIVCGGSGGKNLSD